MNFFLEDTLQRDTASLYERVQWPIPPEKLRNTIIVANHDLQKWMHDLSEDSETITLSSSSKVPSTFRS